LSGFGTMNLCEGVHKIGSRGQHEETHSFKTNSGLPEDNNHTSYVLVIDDISLSMSPYPSFCIQGIGLQGRD
jgi:hypothetical protein